MEFGQKPASAPREHVVVKRDLLKILSVCGIVAPVMIISLILSLGYLQPRYSQVRNIMNELGAEGAPYAFLFNYFGLIPAGLLLSIFSIAVYRWFGTDLLAAISAVCLFISGIALSLVGLFPCALPGCPMVEASFVLNLHFLAALIAVIGLTMAVMSFGLRVFKPGSRGLHTVSSLVLGVVALGALFLIIFSTYDNLVLGEDHVLDNPGLVQKTILFSTQLWVLFTAYSIFTGASSGRYLS